MILPNQPQTARDVSNHYDELDSAYRDIWGEHVHHGYWASGRETAAEAAEALVRLVADRLDLSPGQEVCDIGCGYGATGGWLAEHRQAKVTGFTISEAQARIGRARSERVPGFTCFCRDWLANAMADQSFDRAYAIESSEHMVDKPRFFAEAARVLRPSGRLVVCAWLATERPTPWEVRHLLEPICREGRLPSMGSRSEYEEMAEANGFSLLGYDDISRNVRRTWVVCLRRTLGRLVADPALRRLALSRSTDNRSFLLSLPRLLLALRTGAMRYGVFVWEKKLSGPASSAGIRR
ncbi:MAG: methyltransferase, cyclopropane fatty acid synthase [Alphaproteobacteria bacterium]|nr:methyltransferase, cyclopropane fatty acid synthase [Alphaproteobacteria bacterium]